jgi:fructose-1,6-bisphosphatase/inositol monophosphatase family enzyme
MLVNLDYERLFASSVNEMADLARDIALKYFRKHLAVMEKDDKSPVTKADKEIESRLREVINQRFPGHGIIGEEYGEESPDADFVWVIDPIDGTKAFATGKPLFGTIIGLVHNKRPVVGLIDQTFTKERWLGITDTLCYYNGQISKVAPPCSLDAARFYTAAPEMFQRRL